MYVCLPFFVAAIKWPFVNDRWGKLQITPAALGARESRYRGWKNGWMHRTKQPSQRSLWRKPFWLCFLYIGHCRAGFLEKKKKRMVVVEDVCYQGASLLRTRILAISMYVLIFIRNICNGRKTKCILLQYNYSLQWIYWGTFCEAVTNIRVTNQTKTYLQCFGKTQCPMTN